MVLRLLGKTRQSASLKPLQAQKIPRVEWVDPKERGRLYSLLPYLQSKWKTVSVKVHEGEGKLKDLFEKVQKDAMLGKSDGKRKLGDSDDVPANKQGKNRIGEKFESGNVDTHAEERKLIEQVDSVLDFFQTEEPRKDRATTVDFIHPSQQRVAARAKTVDEVSPIDVIKRIAQQQLKERLKSRQLQRQHMLALQRRHQKK